MNLKRIYIYNKNIYILTYNKNNKIRIILIYNSYNSYYNYNYM